jgi:hypothetical protein
MFGHTASAAWRLSSTVSRTQTTVVVVFEFEITAIWVLWLLSWQ